MSDVIRYAVVGLGRSGWGIHVDQLRGREDARIVAVVDPLEARRNEAASEFGCQTYTSLAEMLKQADVEVVVIATPSAAHAPETIESLRAGKHVVVEKPMAMTLSEADEVMKAAAAIGKKLFVHHNYRFYPEFTHLKELVDSGVLGRVFHIRNYVFNTFARRNDWQTLVKNGGGMLNNAGSHFLDQILQLLPGKVTTICSDLQQIASAGDVEDHVKAFLKTDSGATADMEISTAENIAMPLPKWVICGTHGTLTSGGTGDNEKTIVRWFDPKAAPPLTVLDGPAADRKYGNQDKLPWQEKTIAVPPRLRGTFYDNVFGVLRRRDGMVVTLESVRELMRVMEMVRTAAD